MHTYMGGLRSPRQTNDQGSGSVLNMAPNVAGPDGAEGVGSHRKVSDSASRGPRIRDF